jgi:hypothetical protein
MPPPKDPDPSTFVGQVAANIRNRRLEKFDRAEDAAKAARVPTQTWYHWEQGTRLPLKALPIIAKVVGCTPRQLLPA